MQAGGAKLGCLQIAEALVANGHRAIVASERGRLFDQLTQIGAKHITPPLASKNPLMFARNAALVSDIIRHEKVDIIHARSRAPAWSAYWASKATGIGFAKTYQSEYFEKSRFKNFYNKVMVRGDMVIALSDYMADLIRIRYGMMERHIAVVHRAFDPVRFDLESVSAERIATIRSTSKIVSDDRVLILAGRITPRKVQDHPVEALGILKRGGHDKIISVLAGEIEKSEFKAKTETNACRVSVAEWLRFACHIADIRAAYRMSDLSLTISEREGLPRVAIESQAMAVPIIISNTGPGREVALTAPDVASNEATGLRVPYGYPRALAAAIAELLSWPNDTRSAKGERGARNVRPRFTPDAPKTNTLGVYETVLARRRTGEVTLARICRMHTSL